MNIIRCNLFLRYRTAGLGLKRRKEWEVGFVGASPARCPQKSVTNYIFGAALPVEPVLPVAPLAPPFLPAALPVEPVAPLAILPPFLSAILLPVEPVEPVAT